MISAVFGFLLVVLYRTASVAHIATHCVNVIVDCPGSLAPIESRGRLQSHGRL